MPIAGEEVATIPISASVRDQAPPPAPDSELLAAFVERQDPAALTAIVERYSALVYRVALRSLNDRHLADDVFQATFLVLAQSARRIKDGDLLAAWLHGTARNLARRALTHKQSQRHQLSISTSLTRSQKGGEMSTPAELDPLDQLVRRHEQQLLDEELQNLPESSRAPLVLYYLEEKSQAEIAQLMGLTVEAVEGRLRRAKHDLRLRLIRRGVTLSGVVAAATLLTPSFAAAAPTPALISTTITAALGTAAGTSLAAASTTAATLATKEVAAMSLASKATAFVFGTAGILTVTAGLIFGAVVTSIGREGAERQAAAALVQAELQQLAIEELSTELALADEVPTAVAPASSPTPKDQTPSEPSGKRTTVHQLKGLTPELRDKLKKYVEDLGADVSVHIATESFVVRADQETHQKFSQEINKQRQAIADAETAIHEGKQLLADKQKTLGDDHPEVQRLQAELREKQLFLDTTRAVGTTSHDPLGDETSNLGESPRQPPSEREQIKDEVPPTAVSPGLNWAEKMFSSLSHDFGDVAPGSFHQHVIRITNRYKEPVTLTVPEQLCTCGTVTLDKTVLQSREAALLTITVDTVKYRGQRVATISLNASFEPKNSKPVRIPVTANILRAGIGNGDARLTNVDRENGTVRLNIGEQQNVKTQITFSVYDKSQSRLVHNPAIVKARIEVVETRENSSIARIVEETDPIEVGDIVDSPAWKARGSEHFALSGISDLNSDGVADDRDRTTLMNHLNHYGAVIDVEITSEGVREPADGQLTDQTKWLVVGDVPAHKVSKQHLKLVEEAREQGVRIVALQDFLTYMGWKPESRIYLPAPDRNQVIRINASHSSVTIRAQQNQTLQFPQFIDRVEGFSSEIMAVQALHPNLLRLTGQKAGRTTAQIRCRDDQVYSVQVEVLAPVTVEASNDESTTAAYSAADLSTAQRSEFLDFARVLRLDPVYKSQTESFEVTSSPEKQSQVANFLRKLRGETIAQVSRTERITLEQTELTIQPDEVVHLQFPGPITRAEVQYDRAIDVTPVAEQAAQLRVRGTLAGSCELIATLQNDMIYRVQFQVGKVPEYRFRDLAPREQKIRRALDQEVSMEFPGSSLHEICEFITLMHDIPVQLHGNELKAAGISLDLKVNAVISGISLRSALKLLLEDLKLDYCVDDGALIITTPAELKDRKRLDYYNLSSLSADWQAAAELLIRPLATEVTSLEGGLLVDASLDAHRKLEQFLEQAYQVEKKKPPRPVELGMTKASELPPESEEADKNQPQVRFRVVGFEADQTAIKSLATPSTWLMTPLPDFHRLLKERSEVKGVRVVNDTNLVTVMGKPCAFMSDGAFIPSGTDSSTFTGNQIIISPIRRDDQDRLIAKVSIDLSQLQSQPMVNPEDQTVVGRIVRTTLKLPADHTGLIIDVGNVDREYQLKHAYLWISEEPIRPAVSDTWPPKTAQVGSPSQETQQILAAWQAKATSVRTFSGKLKRIQFDSVSRTETRSEGLLQFERPDQGRIDFSPAPVAWLQKPGRTPPEGKPYKVVSGEPSSIVSTGDDVYMLNFNHKTYDIIDIAPPLKGNYLNRLPPHLQFGMQPPPQDGSYSFQLGAFHNPDGSRLDPHGAPMPKLIHLVATCQLPLEQRSVKPVKFLGIEWPIFRPDPDNLEYLLNPETYLPINMRIVDPTGQHETVYSFEHSSFKVDGGFSHPLANPFQRPNVGGWQLTYHMRDDLKPEPATPTLPKAAPTSSPDSNEAAVQPETIAKEIDLVELSNTTPSEVAEALKLLIEPESWNGTRDIKPLGKSIIVRNTREIVDRCSEAVAEMIAKEQKRPVE